MESIAVCPCLSFCSNCIERRRVFPMSVMDMFARDGEYDELPHGYHRAYVQVLDISHLSLTKKKVTAVFRIP